MSEVVPTVGTPDGILVRRQNNKAVFLTVGFFLLLMFAWMMVMVSLNLSATFLIVGMLAIIGGMLFRLFTASPKVTISLRGQAIVENYNGQETVIPFSDFEAFGFIKNGQGNYWIRIKRATDHKTFQYNPMGITLKKQMPFREFGQAMSDAVADFNAGATPVAERAPANGIVANLSSSPKPIKTGLSKVEKGTNWLVYLYRIIGGIAMLILAIVYTQSADTSDRFFGWAILILPASFVLISSMRERKKKRARQQTLTAEAETA